MNIAADVTRLIGHTPLLRLNRVTTGIPAQIVVKLETCNPSHSVKDRVCLAMIEAAEQAKLIEPGRTVLVEPTGGCIALALALVTAVKGYDCVLVMPAEPRPSFYAILRALGARLIFTDPARGTCGALEKADELLRRMPAAFTLQPFSNPANRVIHEHTTAAEIWNDTDGHVDAVVAGVGTAGTLVGVARALKAHRSDICAVAVEPAASAVLSGGTPDAHGIEGLGPGFIPDLLEPSLIDSVVDVTDEEAYRMTRRLAREEGLLVDASSGAAVVAAIRYACQPENARKLIVVVLPSFTLDHLSSRVFEQDGTERSDDITRLLYRVGPTRKPAAVPAPLPRSRSRTSMRAKVPPPSPSSRPSPHSMKSGVGHPSSSAGPQIPPFCEDAS